MASRVPGYGPLQWYSSPSHHERKDRNMANGSSYYALTVVEQGAGTTAYYALTPTSHLEMSQGGATFDPTAATATMVNIYPQTLQIQAPAGSFTAGVTIVTSADRIAGRLLVSPPVNVAVVVTLYG